MHWRVQSLQIPYTNLCRAVAGLSNTVDHCKSSCSISYTGVISPYCNIVQVFAKAQVWNAVCTSFAAGLCRARLVSQTSCFTMPPANFDITGSLIEEVCSVDSVDRRQWCWYPLLDFLLQLTISSKKFKRVQTPNARCCYKIGSGKWEVKFYFPLGIWKKTFRI